MSCLHFTPHDYQTLREICRRLDLGRRNQPAFNRLLLADLRESAPTLADRIARMRRGESKVLYWHFRDRTLPVADAAIHFTRGELKLVAAACVYAPFAVRLVRPLKGMLVELFRDEWPDLAQKLAHLSGDEFERLYEEVCRLSRKGV